MKLPFDCRHAGNRSIPMEKISGFSAAKDGMHCD